MRFGLRISLAIKCCCCCGGDPGDLCEDALLTEGGDVMITEAEDCIITQQST